MLIGSSCSALLSTQRIVIFASNRLSAGNFLLDFFVRKINDAHDQTLVIAIKIDNLFNGELRFGQDSISRIAFSSGSSRLISRLTETQSQSVTC